jgi:hypothetical protein
MDHEAHQRHEEQHFKPDIGYDPYHPYWTDMREYEREAEEKLYNPYATHPFQMDDYFAHHEIGGMEHIGAHIEQPVPLIA